MRVKILCSSTIICWLIGISPLGKLPQGIFLILGFGCGFQLIQETEALIYDEALAKATKVMQQELNYKGLAMETYAAEEDLKGQYIPKESTYPPEVLEELKQSLEHLVGVEAASGVDKLPTSVSDDKALYLAIKTLLEAGKSETFIVEQILKMSGRRFSKGQERLQSLLERGNTEQW